MTLLCILSAFLTFASAQTEKIEFDDQELARESTLPVFRNRTATKRRNILLTNRFEVGVGAGYLLAEPVAADVATQVYGNYHFNETSAFNFVYAIHSGGLSGYAQTLESPRFGLKFSLTPRIQTSYFGYYQYSAYYGKLSLSRQTVFNMNIYGLIGAGQLAYASESLTAFSFGLGQKIYLSKNWSLRGDLLFYIYEGPDLPKLDLAGISEPQPVSAFPKVLSIDRRLALYLSYLF